MLKAGLHSRCNQFSNPVLPRPSQRSVLAGMIGVPKPSLDRVCNLQQSKKVTLTKDRRQKSNYSIFSTRLMRFYW